MISIKNIRKHILHMHNIHFINISTYLIIFFKMYIEINDKKRL